MYKKLFAGCLFSSAKSRDNYASLPATTSLSQTVLSGDKGSDEDVSSGKDAIIRTVSRRSLSPDDSAQLCKLPADIAAAKGYPYQVHELGPPKPPCQKDRMRTMEVLGLIDAPPDPELDSILKLITGIFDAPTALIGLFDDKKIFIKDATGSFKRGDFPWRWSFCGWTMASQNNQIMVIPDAFEDARFADNVNVRPPGGGPGVRFYCGTPLIASNGHRLGTLCFADTKPRSFDAGQCAILNNMSEMVVRHIEKDIVLQMQQHDNKVLSEAYTQVERALDCFDHCVVLLDTSGPEFKVMYLNAAWDKLTGIPRDQATGHILPDLMEHKLGGHVLGPEHIAAVKKGMEFSVPDAMIKGMAGDKVFILRFRPATQNQLDAYAIPIGVPSFIKSATPEQEASPKLYFMAIEAPSSVASTCSTRSGVSRIREAGEAIEGLAVGHLLGKGSFGDVYSATWFGTTVAVKVIEQDVSDTTATNLEAALAAKLRHPHIVQTLQHFTRKTGRRPQSSSVNYKRSSGTGSGTGSDLLSPAMVSARIGMSPNDTPEGSGSPAPHWAVINFGDRSGGPSASDVGSGMIVCTSAMPPMPAFPTFQHDGADNAPLETVQTWIIMEFCNKGCLQDAIDRGWMRDAPSCVSGKPKMPDVLATAYEIASALCYLHCQGVVHGDLSAYNVLLTSTGTSSTNSRGFSAKIADFGLARALGDVRSKIQTKTYGTLTHQPPETLTAGLISKAVDVYSFGVLLWQMYTFSRPWSGLTHGQIVTQVVSGNSKLHFPAGTPQAFQQLATSCMAFKAEDRPTMEDICQTLEEMVSGDYW